MHGILTRTHRVVAYDRAGLGDSDPDPRPATSTGSPTTWKR
nr:hypothetical protein [Clavibacter michiganensis]